MKVALVITATLMLASCGHKPLPEGAYELRGHVASGPVRAYLSYMRDGGRVVDSVDVVGGGFVFRGVLEEPKEATVYLNYEPEQGFSRSLADARGFFVEPGRIAIESADSVRNATVTGSAATDDARRWQELNAPLDREMKTYYAQFDAMSEEEREQNLPMLRQKKLDAQERRRTMGVEFVAANHDSWFALSRIYPTVADAAEDPDAAQVLMDGFSPRLKQSPSWQTKQAFIYAIRATSIGAPAPDFGQPDRDGNLVMLSDFRGQWVLVDFWASWCRPCRLENPWVVKAYEQYKDRGFTVLGVSLDLPDGRDAWLDAIEHDGLQWTQVSDLTGWDNAAAKAYAVDDIPANFLIDPQGTIVAKDLRREALEQELAKHFRP